MATVFYFCTGCYKRIPLPEREEHLWLVHRERASQEPLREPKIRPDAAAPNSQIVSRSTVGAPANQLGGTAVGPKIRTGGGQVKVYQIAFEFGLDPLDVIRVLRSAGIGVKNKMSKVDSSNVDRFRGGMVSRVVVNSSAAAHVPASSKVSGVDSLGSDLGIAIVGSRDIGNPSQVQVPRDVSRQETVAVLGDVLLESRCVRENCVALAGRMSEQGGLGGSAQHGYSLGCRWRFVRTKPCSARSGRWKLCEYRFVGLQSSVPVGVPVPRPVGEVECSVVSDRVVGVLPATPGKLVKPTPLPVPRNGSGRLPSDAGRVKVFTSLCVQSKCESLREASSDEVGSNRCQRCGPSVSCRKRYLVEDRCYLPGSRRRICGYSLGSIRGQTEAGNDRLDITPTRQLFYSEKGPAAGEARPMTIESAVRVALGKSFEVRRIVHSMELLLVESLTHSWSVLVAFGSRTEVVRLYSPDKLALEASRVRARVHEFLRRHLDSSADKQRVEYSRFYDGRLTEHGWKVSSGSLERQDAIRSAIFVWGAQTIQGTLQGLMRLPWARDSRDYTSRIQSDMVYARTGQFVCLNSFGRALPRTLRSIAWMDR